MYAFIRYFGGNIMLSTCHIDTQSQCIAVTSGCENIIVNYVLAEWQEWQDCPLTRMTKDILKQGG